MSSSPPIRRAPFGTSLEANVELRSRGWSNPMSPTSVPTVFGVVPLRELPDPRPAGSPRSYPKWSVSSASMPRSKTALTSSGRNPPAPVNATPPSSTRDISWSNSWSENSSRRNARAAGSDSAGRSRSVISTVNSFDHEGPLTQRT
jgi:hypothetical protein